MRRRVQGAQQLNRTLNSGLVSATWSLISDSRRLHSRSRIAVGRLRPDWLYSHHSDFDVHQFR